MKLSELVAYRNQLNCFSLEQAKTCTDIDISHVKHVINTKDFDPNNLKGQLQAKHHEIHQKFNDLAELVEQARQEAQTEIDLKEQYWLAETHRLYSEEMIHDSDEHILNRRPNLSPEQDNIIRARIKNFSTNMHPGMIIRPGLETFIQDMVSFDPLYLVDRNNNMLFPSTLEFPEQYQRRLRYYTINEFDDSNPKLDRLPDNQFGMCLAYNFFNFKPIEVIDSWLTEIFVKLKPGGRLMMTFNDCDRPGAPNYRHSRVPTSVF